MNDLQLAGAVFTLIVGTLLHFTYAWWGKNGLIGVFSATNESTWEHLKLLAMPLLLFGLIEYFIRGKGIANFIPVKALSLFLGMGTIVILFYTYVGIVGKHFLWADIGTFVLGVLAAYTYSAALLDTPHFSSHCAIRLGWIGLLVVFASFAVFTFFPPPIGLFLDPVSHRYGR
ncbi:MAG: DUF6512 family protein [Oscillospiraceae bacterium]